MNDKQLKDYVKVLGEMWQDGSLVPYFEYQRGEITDHPRFEKHEAALSKLGMMERGKAFNARSKKQPD